MSNKDAESVRREQHDFEKSVHEHFDIAEGVNAAMTLSFLALPVIPHLKITDRGLFDVDKFAFTDKRAGSPSIYWREECEC